MSTREVRLQCLEIAIRTSTNAGMAVIGIAKAIERYLDGTDVVTPWRFPYGKIRWFIGGKEVAVGDVFTMLDTGPGASAELDLSDFKNARGGPGQIQGDWSFSTSTPDIVTVTGTGALSFDVMPVAGGPTDDAGAFTVTASADTDLGDGVRPYMLTGHGVVVSDQGGVVGGSIKLTAKAAA